MKEEADGTQVILNKKIVSKMKKIEIEKINEILDRIFLANGYNCDEKSDRRLWVAAREVIKEILDQCNIEIVKPKEHWYKEPKHRRNTTAKP